MACASGCRRRNKCAEPIRAIQASVAEKAGAEHFAGVTVQPMVRRDGYELILGSAVDAQFGPVILFGSGGVMVEVYRDRALALPPLNTTLAQRMMEQTKIFSALQGVRGRKPVNLTALEGLLVRFSQLVMEQPWIKEIDINPLLATPEQLLALDARVVVHDSACSAAQLPRATIRPYPSQYVWEWRIERRHAGDDPADSSGGRAAHGAVPHHAVGAQRLPAIFLFLESEHESGA